jgi:hypothetical protein
MTYDIVKENIDKLWNWSALSRNKNITWGVIGTVKENLDKPWDWLALSTNPDITWSIVKEYIDKPWNLSALSMNPNIKWDIVKDNLDIMWDWSTLCTNQNMLLSIDDLTYIVESDHSASVIQRVWRRVISDPNHLVCKRRLLREYADCEFL